MHDRPRPDAPPDDDDPSPPLSGDRMPSSEEVAAAINRLLGATLPLPQARRRERVAGDKGRRRKT